MIAVLLLLGAVIMSMTDRLMIDEGVRLKPYRDSVGNLTIGVGHLLTTGELAQYQNGITIKTARALLDQDLAFHRAALFRHVPVARTLDDVRQSVLVNMAFNLGIEKLQGFKQMLAALERRDYASAAHEMLNSKWAKQVGKRAKRLADEMRTGQPCWSDKQLQILAQSELINAIAV